MTEAIPTLPQHDPRRTARLEAIARQGERYAFDREYFGILFSTELPADERYDWTYNLAAGRVAAEILTNRLAQHALRVPHATAVAELARRPREALRAVERAYVRRSSLPPTRPATPDDYTRLFATVPRPLALGRIDDDAFFAWRQLAGMTPISLRRLDRVPDHVALDDAAFRRADLGEERLDGALAEGRLFAVDYALLEPLRAGSSDGHQKYVAAPIAVFLSGVDGMRPVAIQLGQRPAPDAPVLTPTDGVAWRMAKAVVNSAEMAFNGIVAHFGLCHIVAEGLICVSHRTLAPWHPLMRLLLPHFRYTLATNVTARADIVNVGGRQEYLMGGTLETNFEVLRRALREERYDAFGLRADLTARGVDDRGALRDYPFRDDGLPLADALHRWARGYLDAYYVDDAEVRRDVELQHWAESLGRDGGWSAVPVLDGVSALSRFVGDILWRLTGFHAVVNYSGFDFAGCPTDTPSALFGRLPMPGATEEDWRTMLPPLSVANGMLEQMYALRGVRVNRLGDYPFAHFRDERVFDAISAFRAELGVIENLTAARDMQRRWRFPHLIPSKVSNSIHV